MRPVHIALILLSGILAYSNTFHVPFFFDDGRAIVDNFMIKNLENFWPPTGTRWFGTLTFALNYAAGGLQVPGYHAVNLIIHLTASLLLYRFVVLTLQTPFFPTDQSAIRETTSSLIALAAALLFVSHPIQTQAVTYIVQRFTVLATLFFLASMVCYIQGRINHIEDGNIMSKSGKNTITWYAAALVWAVLAMKTKEIAFTLPFVIVVYEFSFFPGRKLTERLNFLIPMVLTLLIIPLSLLSVGPEGVSVTSNASDVSRHDYLLTQFRVIVTYIGLLILPVNQMIDYVFPISQDILDPSVFLSLLLLSALFLSSVSLLILGGRGKIPSELRVAGFGGLWFFITLSVESSVIPITDVIFEHRLYLPSAGVFIAVVVSGSVVIRLLSARFPRSSSGMAAIITGLAIALPIATFLRNDIWRSEITLWEDVASKSPDNARARANIGFKLIESKQVDQAIARFQEAIRIKPDYADAIISLGNAYLEKGMLDEGYQQYLKALVLGNIDLESRALLMMNIGTYNLRKGFPDRAIYYYQNALSITPDVASIHFNLGLAYKIKGMSGMATKELGRARQLNPDRF